MKKVVARGVPLKRIPEGQAVYAVTRSVYARSTAVRWRWVVWAAPSDVEHRRHAVAGGFAADRAEADAMALAFAPSAIAVCQWYAAPSFLRQIGQAETGAQAVQRHAVRELAPELAAEIADFRKVVGTLAKEITYERTRVEAAWSVRDAFAPAGGGKVRAAWLVSMCRFLPEGDPLRREVELVLLDRMIRGEA